MYDDGKCSRHTSESASSQSDVLDRKELSEKPEVLVKQAFDAGYKAGAQAATKRERERIELEKQKAYDKGFQEGMKSAFDGSP